MCCTVSHRRHTERGNSVAPYAGSEDGSPGPRHSVDPPCEPPASQPQCPLTIQPVNLLLARLGCGRIRPCTSNGRAWTVHAGCGRSTCSRTAAQRAASSAKAAASRISGDCGVVTSPAPHTGTPAWAGCVNAQRMRARSCLGRMSRAHISCWQQGKLRAAFRCLGPRLPRSLSCAASPYPLVTGVPASGNLAAGRSQAKAAVASAAILCA